MSSCILFVKRNRAAAYCAVSLNVFVDGTKVLSIKNGKEERIPVSAGNHEVIFKVNGQVVGTVNISLDANNSRADIICSPQGMGWDIYSTNGIVHKKSNSGKTIIATISAIFIIIFVFFLIADMPADRDSSKGDRSVSGSGQKQEAVEEKHEEKTIEIHAYDLMQAYVDNEVAADEKYKNKIVSVTGTVSDITKGIISDNPCVVLESGHVINSIQCFFRKNNQTDLLSALKDGDEVVITGRCIGFNVYIIQLSNCSIEVK